MRRAGLASALAVALAACVAALGGGATAAGAAAGTQVLAPTPYMGWDTYLALQGGFTEATILQEANLLKTTGLEADGYRIVWLDATWWQGKRDAAGNIVVSSTQWPHGIAWLANTLHQNGFKLGVYTDAGSTGCGVNGGAFGHYQQDINTFAKWGVDAIKVDWCGGSAQGLNPATQYAQLRAAILANSSHRPMMLNICNFLQPGQKGPNIPVFQQSAFFSYSFGPTSGTSWRTDTDVGVPGNVSYGSVLRNLDADGTEPQAAGPGHWNDPDYLAPDQGMNAAQFRSQFSMWAILAAPLMISDDLRSISASALQTLTNKQVIAIDQDPAGIQGAEIPSPPGNGEIWAKPMLNGNVAIAFLNRGSTPVSLSTTAAAVQLPVAAHYSVDNVWSGQTYTGSGSFSATVPAYSTVLLRVAPAA
jgi:alpha-galactosidase